MAFGLYSALPLPQIEWKNNTMRYALAFLPLIGVVIGLCQLGWLWLAQTWNINTMLYAAGAVVVPVGLTGGIHLDGFTDTCDALCSYGNRQKRLEILKDPHIGAFGVLWLIVLLLVQFGLFAQLYDAPDRAVLLGAGYAMSRTCGGYLIVAQPCAKNSGLARLFSDHTDKKRVKRVMLAWMVVCACVWIASGTWFGLFAVGATALFFVYYIRKCRKIFGGITGDLCGMCITICELLVLGTAVIGGLCLR